MKPSFFVTAILLFFIFVSATPVKKDRPMKQESSIFVGDSGYVLKKDGVKILLTLNDKDSIDLSFSDLKDTDTIGKFYRSVDGKAYVACISDVINEKLSPSHFLLKFDTDGKMLYSERTINGFYLCCWENKYDGFSMHNGYYFFKTCGTGSAFCSGDVYAFKDVANPEATNTIVKSVFSGMCAGGPRGLSACKLTSKIQKSLNGLLFHYTYQNGFFNKKDKFKVTHTEKFDIEYIVKNGEWMATDSTKLKSINLGY